MGKFGDKFRKEREKKGISLDDVSNVTKIGSRMLQAIEEERFDQLPGGVFNKGFIRAYAKHLGLNDEDAVTDYLACLRQAQIDSQAAWEPGRPQDAHTPGKPKQTQPAPTPAKKVATAVKPQPPKSQSPAPTPEEELPDLQLPRAEHVRRPKREFLGKREGGIPWGIIAAALLVVALGAFLWTRHSRSTRTAAASTAHVTQPSAQASPPVFATASQTSASTATPKPGTSPRAATPNPPIPTATTTTKPATPQTETATKPLEENDVVVRTFPATANGAAKPATPMTLIIRASENSWVSISADGQTPAEETLIAPAHTSIRANREIVVKVGNAAGVSFLFNGSEVPADGTEAEVKTFTFDASGMHASPTPQANRQP